MSILIEFIIFVFYKTALYSAVEDGLAEIVKLLLSHPGIDVNCQSVLFVFSFYEIQVYDF